MVYTYQYPHPAVTVDIVAFRLQDNDLQVLLVRRDEPPYAGKWALPGSFVGIDEDLSAAAKRVLQEKGDLSGLSLTQIAAFGAPKRDPRERVISIAYLAVLPPAAINEGAGSWNAVDRVSKLAFDHASILEQARAIMMEKLDGMSWGLPFLPNEFTLSEAQTTFERLLNKNFDKRNFRKKFLSKCDLEDTGYVTSGGSHRPARLYRKNA